MTKIHPPPQLLLLDESPTYFAERLWEPWLFRLTSHIGDSMKILIDDRFPREISDFTSHSSSRPSTRTNLLRTQLLAQGLEEESSMAALSPPRSLQSVCPLARAKLGSACPHLTKELDERPSSKALVDDNLFHSVYLQDIPLLILTFFVYLSFFFTSAHKGHSVRRSSL